MPNEFTTPPGDDQAAVLRGVLDGGELGAIEVAWSPRGLVSIRFAAGVKGARGVNDAQTPVPRNYADVLTRYFRGEPVDPVLLLVDLVGTPFQLRVWNALRRIPRGRVKSYASIAAEIGSARAMRAVGMASARNRLPIVVPCHRVIEAGLHLGGYSAGIERKIALLRLEGVQVEGDRVLPGQLDLF